MSTSWFHVLALSVQLFVFTLQVTLDKKNVCRYWSDYNTGMAGNRNCWYNPDMTLTTQELIEKYTGGKSQSYEMTTDDGYILTMYRFPPPPGGMNKGAVLMRHPLFLDSRVWVTQGNTSTAPPTCQIPIAQSSLAGLLELMIVQAVLVWRDGWDVWLANNRGTADSERHVNMSSSQSKFWDYAFDDIGQQDVRTEVKLIRSTTGRKIYYVGHSLGSTSALVYGSTYPQEARDSIEVFILAAPACYCTAPRSPAHSFYVIQPILEFAIHTLDLGPCIPILPTIYQVVRVIFRAFPPITYLVNIGYSWILGWALEETDPQFINLDMILNIKNASWKLVFHFLQLVRSRTRFQKYDYGPAENTKRYGTARPPEYPVWDITVPTYLISSTQDALTTLRDADILYSRLQPEAKKYGYLHVTRLNHMDYHSGKHRIELYVDHVIKLLNKIQNTR